MCKVIVTLLKSLCLLVGCMEESYSVQFLEKLENVFIFNFLEVLAWYVILAYWNNTLSKRIIQWLRMKSTFSVNPIQSKHNEMKKKM